jgi:hypothetical protein
MPPRLFAQCQASVFALEGEGGAIDQPEKAGFLLRRQRIRAVLAPVLPFISLALW